MHIFCRYKNNLAFKWSVQVVFLTKKVRKKVSFFKTLQYFSNTLHKWQNYRANYQDLQKRFFYESSTQTWETFELRKNFPNGPETHWHQSRIVNLRKFFKLNNYQTHIFFIIHTHISHISAPSKLFMVRDMNLQK